MRTKGIRQRDASDCGAACLSYIAAFYGCYKSVAAIRQWAGTDEGGTTVAGIMTAAGKLGFAVQGIRCTPADLHRLDLPAIIHVVTKHNTYHYLVLVSRTAGSVYVMDPATGTHRKISNQDFEKQWTGVAVLVEPNEDFRTLENIAVWKRIRQLFFQNKYTLLCVFTCAVVYTVAGILMSVYLQQVTDAVFAESEIGLLTNLSLIMLAVLICQAGVAWLKAQWLVQTSEKIDTELVMKYFRHVVHLPKKFHDTMRVGEVMSRINDAGKINSFVTNAFVQMIIDVLTLLLSITLMFIYDTRLAFIVAIIIPLYVGLYLLSDRRNQILLKRTIEAGAELDSAMMHGLSRVSTIKFLNLEDQIIAGVARLFQNALRMSRRLNLFQSGIFTAADFTTRMFTLVTVWYGGYYVLEGSLSPGEMVSFFSLLSYFTAPAVSLMGAGRQVRDTIISCDRLLEITDLEAEDLTDTCKEVIPGDLEFRDVTFRYPGGSCVLNRLSFVIKSGLVTGITGPSGSGKTTLTSLILRLYEPVAGDIYLAGLPLDSFPTAALRRSIGIVPQKTELFNISIRDNIVIGNTSNIDEAWLKTVAEKTGVSDISDSSPAGLATLITEQGSNLSGGQKQKVAIARALYRKSRLLILDEPTSSLDAASEMQIMQTIEWYKKLGNTVIIISHSDRALKICDNIVILKKILP